ncbi:MAG: glutamate 5-kinase [Candidatus Omnitrophota bacterium]
MKKVVVKIGSSVLAPAGKLDSSLIHRLVKDILSVEQKGGRVILVSSGAIACGMNCLGYKRKPQDLSILSAISSVGQIVLMDVFNAKFSKYKRRCAQILLTWDDFDNRRRFMNIRSTIEKLLEMNIVPIINENDVVSHEEIRFGDNDRLSALVADLIAAEALIILSNVEGLFDGTNILKEVRKMEEKITSLARKERITHTSGGMNSKLLASGIAMSSGIRTTIAYGRKKDVISRIVNGEALGTLFLPAEKRHKARKRWIAFSKKPKGKIFIDKGAQEAVLFKGKSLLAVGIINAEGKFKQGDAVVVVDSAGELLGYGLVNYDSETLCNHREKKFEKEVIHRDNFVAAAQELCCNPYVSASDKQALP